MGCRRCGAVLRCGRGWRSMGRTMSRSSGPGQAAVALSCALALAGCAALRPPVASAPPAMPDPFDDASASFTVRGARFAPGETAIIQVCVTAGGTIESADVVGSSGDKRFDDFALLWARQVKLRSFP